MADKQIWLSRSDNPYDSIGEMDLEVKAKNEQDETDGL